MMALWFDSRALPAEHYLESVVLQRAFHASESLYRPNLPIKKARMILLELTPKMQRQLI
jgi:hypothetical protein